jgi:hypothetical protein
VTIELSDAEWKVIRGWYQVAESESYTALEGDTLESLTTLKGLLDKLQIPYEYAETFCFEKRGLTQKAQG